MIPIYAWPLIAALIGCIFLRQLGHSHPTIPGPDCPTTSTRHQATLTRIRELEAELGFTSLDVPDIPTGTKAKPTTTTPSLPPSGRQLGLAPTRSMDDIYTLSESWHTTTVTYTTNPATPVPVPLVFSRCSWCRSVFSPDSPSLRLANGSLIHPACYEQQFREKP